MSRMTESGRIKLDVRTKEGKEKTEAESTIEIINENRNRHDKTQNRIDKI